MMLQILDARRVHCTVVEDVRLAHDVAQIRLNLRPVILPLLLLVLRRFTEHTLQIVATHAAGRRFVFGLRLLPVRL